MRDPRVVGRACRAATAAAVVLLLSACDSTLVNPQVPPPGHSAAFEDGYLDGCSFGFQDAGRDGYQQAGRKDQARYLAEPDYKAGFEDGHQACFEEERKHPKMLGGGGGDFP